MDMYTVATTDESEGDEEEEEGQILKNEESDSGLSFQEKEKPTLRSRCVAMFSKDQIEFLVSLAEAAVVLLCLIGWTMWRGLVVLLPCFAIFWEATKILPLAQLQGWLPRIVHNEDNLSKARIIINVDILLFLIASLVY